MQNGRWFEREWVGVGMQISGDKKGSKKRGKVLS